MFKSAILHVLCLSFLPTLVFAQKDVVNYRAKQLVCDKLQGQSCIRLKGDVVFDFPSNGIVLHADEACKYNDSGLIEAYGRVQIESKEGYIVQADKISYDPQKKLATLENNVVCKSKDSTLYTPKLFYDFTKKQGEFVNRGKVVYKETVVTSFSGMYNEANQTFKFVKDVVLIEPSFTIHSEHLCYNFKKEEIFFKNRTKVSSSESTLTTEKGGYYCIPAKKFIVQKGTLTNKDFKLYADTLEIFDDQDYKAKNHVLLTIASYDVVLVGDEITYSTKTHRVEISGHPLLKKALDNEMVYVRADKFVILTQVQENVNSIQEFHALHAVRFFHENFQGVADRIVYNLANDTMRFSSNPIIWCDGYQVTGDEMNFTIGSKCSKMLINKDAFLVSSNKKGYYNQIKGKQLIAEFEGYILEKMLIKGNSESLFFIFADNQEFIGMNYIKCDNMEIAMADNKLKQIKFMPHPNGTFYPSDKIDDNKRQLSGFSWYKGKCPTKESILAPLK